LLKPLVFLIIEVPVISEPIDSASPLWCGFGIVGVTICSMILYKQKPDLAAIIAMALIISGAIVG
jgi:small multidrug resistance pump